jgi:hypothetical protein
MNLILQEVSHVRTSRSPRAARHTTYLQELADRSRQAAWNVVVHIKLKSPGS